MSTKIHIHKPDGLHGWGLEYNCEPEISINGEAAAFVRQCRTRLKPHWFHQSGSETPDRGYQFFEFLGPNPESTVRKAAEDISAILGCTVE